MIFIKRKLKRCDDCIYIRTLGALHYCIRTKRFITVREGNGTTGNLPLICFKKKKANKFINKIVEYDRVTDSDIDMHIS